MKGELVERSEEVVMSQVVKCYPPRFLTTSGFEYVDLNGDFGFTF